LMWEKYHMIIEPTENAAKIRGETADAKTK
jgi:hypothetical protein